MPEIHFSAFRITELVPDRSVAWLVTDSWLTFIEDEEEWTGTTVRFDVVPTDAGTEVRFTHEGLVPRVECYDVCRVAWGEYVVGSLRSLIETGTGRPNSYEDLDVAREAARADAVTRGPTGDRVTATSCGLRESLRREVVRMRLTNVAAAAVPIVLGAVVTGVILSGSGDELQSAPSPTPSQPRRWPPTTRRRSLARCPRRRRPGPTSSAPGSSSPASGCPGTTGPT